MKNKFDKAEKQILEILEKKTKPLSKNMLAKQLRISTSAVSKYVDILEAQGKIQVERYGSIHLVSNLNSKPVGK